MRIREGFIFILLPIITVHCSLFRKFTDYSPQLKLHEQSKETFSKFKKAFMHSFMRKELTSEKMKEKFLEGIEEVSSPVQAAYLVNTMNSDRENPQVQLGKLAFMYEAMNRADLATATALDRMCNVENLINAELNPNICGTYVPYLLKLIELRLSVVTSRLVYSEGLVGIPKGWIEHVQGMVKDLENAGFLSDSLRHLYYLLRGLAKNNDEVDVAILPNLLSSKGFPTSMANPIYADNTVLNETEHSSHATPPPTKITIDASNLTKKLVDQKQHDTSNLLDPMLAQMLPKMMIM